MKILAIDTSSKNCSVAIVEIEKEKFNIINFKNSDDERTHSQKLMPMIKESFEDSGLTLDNIDLLACCVGPGSFTGIRIGVATVKAFADAKNIPVVGITSLESLAYNVFDKGYIIPLIDAKNNNVYSSLFLHDNSYSLELEHVADNIDIILDKFSSYINNNNKDVYFVGDCIDEYKELIMQKFNNIKINFAENNIQSGLSLTKCAYNKYLSGIYGDSNCLSPIYLRKSQAERTANEQK